MPSQLFAVVPDDRFIVLQLQVSNMDPEACDDLRSLLDEQLESRPLPVVLDLSRAKFLPSLALGALVNLKRKLDESNTVMTLVGLSSNIRRALDLSHLDRVFPIADSVDQVPTPAAAH